MARRTVNKPTAGAVTFVLNHKRGPEYNATFLNLTGASITIQVTNENIQTATSPTFANPAAGVLTVADDTMGALTEPYEAAEITGAGTGDIHVVEAG